MTDDDFDDPPARYFSHNLAATTTTGLRQLRRTATPNLGECGEVTSYEWTRSVELYPNNSHRYHRCSWLMGPDNQSKLQVVDEVECHAAQQPSQ